MSEYIFHSFLFSLWFLEKLRLPWNGGVTHLQPHSHSPSTGAESMLTEWADVGKDEQWNKATYTRKAQ